MPPRPKLAALTLQQHAFRPRHLTGVLTDTLTARAETKGLSAEVAVSADLPEMLVGDPVRLRAAIENLIDNAVKFTERGVVRLEAQAARAARGRVKLVVGITDNGIGLTPRRGQAAVPAVCAGQRRILPGVMAAPGSGSPSSSIWPS